MAKISREKILEAVISGLNNAQEKYLQWTKNNYSIGTGAEYVLTTYVAEEVFNVYHDFLFIEEPISSLIEDHKELQTDQNFLDAIRSTGRTDIALYTVNKEEKKPKAIIELKNRVSRLKDGIKLDIDRIEALVNNDIVEYGIIAFVTEVEQNKKLDIEDIENKMYKIVMDCKNHKSLRYKYKYEVFKPKKTGYKNYHWAWGSCAIVLSKK